METRSCKEHSMIWSLEGILSNGKRWFIPINRLPFRIGRSKECQLSLAPKTISRFHAEIHQSEDSLWIHDFGSSNGTFINKKRIKKKAFLKDGDIIHIADIEFRVSSKDYSHFQSQKKTQKTIDIEKDFQSNFVSCEKEFFNMLSECAVVPFFQPIVKLSNIHTIGYEILGRCHFKGLPSTPLELFKIADSLGCETQLSELFQREGVRQGDELPEKSILFINTHPHEILQKSILKSFLEIRKLAPKRPIILEIHEKAITDVEYMKYLKAALSDINIGLAYDDFGSGQARLIDLIEIPPNVLKFDRAFVHNIHRASLRKQQILERLVKMTHDFGIIPLAECIESKEESDVCRQLGFRYGQGFYYGRPDSIASLKK